MGRYISCGIATQIIVYGKGCLQKNKKDFLYHRDRAGRTCNGSADDSRFPSFYLLI